MDWKFAFFLILSIVLPSIRIGMYIGYRDGYEKGSRAGKIIGSADTLRKIVAKS